MVPVGTPLADMAEELLPAPVQVEEQYIMEHLAKVRMHKVLVTMMVLLAVGAVI